MGLKIFSHNVQRFNSPNKRKKADTIRDWEPIYYYYKRPISQPLIILNTLIRHITNFIIPHFPIRHGIAIRNSIVFNVQEIYKDMDSRFIIIKGLINSKPLTITSLNAPMNHNPFSSPNFFIS